VLPFDPHTCELDEAVWRRWLAWDPVHLVDEYRRALASLRLIYLDAGTKDDFNLQFGARIFCDKLGQRGIGFVPIASIPCWRRSRGRCRINKLD
jgi:enterochelin esterase family protein